MEYEITKDELNELLEAGKPTPAMFLSGGRPMFGTPQENVDRIWQKLANKYCFIWDTVKPISDKGNEFFTADKK